MYLRDVITQLRNKLPNFSNSFSEQLALSALSFSGGLVTASTATAHGYATGDILNIIAAQENVPITSISTVDGVATVVTSSDHGLTLDYQDPINQPEVEIFDCTVSGYNGSFVLVSVDNRTQFSFTIIGNPGAATDGGVKKLSPAGYSGLKEITVTTSTAFTYVAENLTANGVGGVAHSDLRISGDIDIERFGEAYSKQATAKLWLAVVPNPTAASKSRHSLNDSTSQFTEGQEYRQNILPAVNIYLFVPTSNKLSGRGAYDTAIEESIPLFNSLLTFKIASPYCISNYSGITFEAHGPFNYNSAFYVHEFTFSTVQQLVIGDGYTPNLDVAFRDIEFDLTPEHGSEKMNSKIKLDQ